MFRTLPSHAVTLPVHLFLSDFPDSTLRPPKRAKKKNNLLKNSCINYLRLKIQTKFCAYDLPKISSIIVYLTAVQVRVK
jgi:hypothetical protein